MIEKTLIRPYHKGDAEKLVSFLAEARFLLGDDDFSPNGKHVLYFLFSERLDILGLVEAEVSATRHLNRIDPSLLITKIALRRGYEDEEFILSLLSYLIRECGSMDTDYLYLLGEEVPFEKELGFVNAAALGLYTHESSEENIPSLRLRYLGDPNRLAPGFLYRL